MPPVDILFGLRYMKTLFLSVLAAAGMAMAVDIPTPKIFLTSTEASESAERGDYYGFTLSLADAFMVTVPRGELPQSGTVILNSITLQNRTTETPQHQVAPSMRVAIYTPDQQFVGLSSETFLTGKGKANTYVFMGVELDVKTRYTFIFVSPDVTTEFLATTQGLPPLEKRVRFGLELYSYTSDKGADSDCLFLNKALNNYQTGSFLPVVTFQTFIVPPQS